MPRSTARLPRVSFLLAALALVAVACGPRFDRSEVEVTSGQPVSENVVNDTGGAGSGDTPIGDDTSGDIGGDTDVGSDTGTDTGGDAGGSDGTTDGTAGNGTGSGAQPGDTGGGDDGGTEASDDGGDTSEDGGSQTVAAGPRPGISDQPCEGYEDTTEGCILVGYLVPLTGAAPLPTSWDEGANFVWDYFNKRGGINGYGVELIIEDTESSTTTAVNKARKLVTQDRVFTIITLDRLEVQDAVAQFLEQANYPHIMIQSPADPPDSWRNTFTISIDHIVQGRAIAQFWADDLGAADGGKKVAWVREQTNALKPGVDAFDARAAELGVDVVERQTINPSQQEFSQTILALQNSGAEIVWLYMAPTPAATIIQQANAQFQYRPTWFANSISWNFELLHQAAGPGINGAYAFSPWVSLSSPRADEFKQAWRDAKGSEPDDFGLVGWGVGQVTKAALESPGDDIANLGHDSFRAAMTRFRFSGNVWAPVDFTAGGPTGSSAVAVFKSDGSAWQTQGDFRSFG